MRTRRALAALLAVGLAALVVPVITAAEASASTSTLSPACNVTYEPRGSGSFSVWARCLADRSTAITDVRIYTDTLNFGGS